MVVTMLCTVATQSWVAVAEMGFSPSALALKASLTWETSSHVGLQNRKRCQVCLVETDKYWKGESSVNVPQHH